MFYYLSLATLATFSTFSTLLYLLYTRRYKIGFEYLKLKSKYFPILNAKLEKEILYIDYHYNNLPYTLMVPYDMSKALMDSSKEIYMKKDNQNIKINHQPGLNFYLTGNQLKCDNLFIYDTAFDENIQLKIDDSIIEF